MHDAQASISLLVRPLISYAEVSLELPCSPSLWHAKTAQTWRVAYLQNTGHSARLPSLMNCVHDLHPLSKFQSVIDTQYSSTIILHAIWSLIAEYRQLEFVLKLQATQDRHWNGGLISSSWHQELSQLLEHFHITVSSFPCGVRLEQTMIQELFSMNLYVSFEELQLFAGKEGNEEAQRVYPLLKLWFENRRSRQAVWHAGQVIRAALAFPPNHLRDFYAVALYHAALAIWVYGMVSLGSGRRRARKNAGLTSGVCLSGRRGFARSEALHCDFEKRACDKRSSTDGKQERRRVAGQWRGWLREAGRSEGGHGSGHRDLLSELQRGE